MSILYILYIVFCNKDNMLTQEFFTCLFYLSVLFTVFLSSSCTQCRKGTSLTVVLQGFFNPLNFLFCSDYFHLTHLYYIIPRNHISNTFFILLFTSVTRQKPTILLDAMYCIRKLRLKSIILFFISLIHLF